MARSGAARNQGGRRALAARRPALSHQPLEDAGRSAGPGGRRWPRPTRSIWPPPAYRRYQNALKAPAPSISTTCCCAPRNCSTTFPEVRRAEAGRFDHLLVDEYQDTNGSQYRIVKALGRPTPQPVRGGRRRPVDLRLARRGGGPHPAVSEATGPRPKSCGWKQNYRSTAEILALANRLIAFNKLRHGRCSEPHAAGEQPRILQFKDEVDRGETVVGEIGRWLQRGRVGAARLRHPLPHQRAAAACSKPICGGPRCPMC